ncbi:DNA helicase [Rhodopseudomonas palustris]|uniref:DNA helicase n=1 Tax=Rhodopseudomonas palustris TaxID=1076 RepID=UPI0022F031EE|nr:DNA helicase [Rhodopseudomonas palustris]WBU32388.1 DNA helicase [Rhodopseudomonas palustris]
MRLSAPVYRLKRKAKLLSRAQNVPLHAALDHVAATEGFERWSLLVESAAASPAVRLFGALNPGDLVLLGARPGQGKTLLSLELAVEAIKAGRTSAFFTLEYTEAEVLTRLRAIGADPASLADKFTLDTSDAICCDYIMARLASAARGSLVVIDYLQLLDRRRDTPDLNSQIRALRSFARSAAVILVIISQIDRSYDPAKKRCPDLSDVRLMNELDLSLFSHACFVGADEIRWSPVPAAA